MHDHTHWMQLALQQAEAAAALDEVPVGAVLVRDDELLASGHNRVILDSDPTAHAEIVALRAAARAIGNYRLPGSTLYVTLEPCTQCVGALIHARIAHLVFAAREPKAGVVCSRAALLDSTFYNHRVTWEEGLLAQRSSDMLQAFFRRRRSA